MLRDVVRQRQAYKATRASLERVLRSVKKQIVRRGWNSWVSYADDRRYHVDLLASTVATIKGHALRIGFNTWFEVLYPQKAVARRRAEAPSAVAARRKRRGRARRTDLPEWERADGGSDDDDDDDFGSGDEFGESEEGEEEEEEERVVLNFAAIASHGRAAQPRRPSQQRPGVAKRGPTRSAEAAGRAAGGFVPRTLAKARRGLAWSSCCARRARGVLDLSCTREILGMCREPTVCSVSC